MRVLNLVAFIVCTVSAIQAGESGNWFVAAMFAGFSLINFVAWEVYK